MTVTKREKQVLDILADLGIVTIRHEHPPVNTVEDASEYWADLQATHCKNLFLRNNKGNRHYLVIAETTTKVDLKTLNRLLGEDRLSFASPKRLMRHLGVEPGSVSPFGLINDSGKDVLLVLDEDLKKSDAFGFHPNVNTATLEITRPDFDKFLTWCGTTVRYLRLK